MADIQSRINNLNTKVSNINSELTNINSQTPCNSTMENCFNKMKTQLEKKKEILTQRITTLQSTLDSFNATYNFTTEEQAVLDEISSLFSGKYDKYFSKLKFNRNETLRNTFFNNYSLAGSDFEKELVAKMTFGVVDS